MVVDLIQSASNNYKSLLRSVSASVSSSASASTSGGGGSKVLTSKTSTSDTYDAYLKYEITSGVDILTIGQMVLQKLLINQPYLPTTMVAQTTATINAIMTTPPKYIINLVTGSYYTNTTSYECRCRTWHKWFKKKKWCATCWNGYTTWTWKFDLNGNFKTMVNNSKNQLQMISTAIDNYKYNNCDNPNSLVNNDILDKCSIDTQNGSVLFSVPVNDLYTLSKDQKEISEKTLSQIKNSSDYPQYNIANTVNSKVGTVADWNIMTNRDSQYPNYSEYKYGQLINRVDALTNIAKQSYNDCETSTSLTSLDDNGLPVPSCINEKYNDAIITCNNAWEKSNTYKYGTSKLMNLWTDVSNSIPGNTIGTNTTILTNAQDSCQKWVEMFNEWEKEEEAAISKPCDPERPITSLNDDTIKKISAEWNETATAHINQLTTRLNSIKTEMKIFPNILELKKENIIDAPAGMIPTVSVKKQQTEFGTIPLQYLEMLIPMGPAGDTGEQGPMGMPGADGSDGPQGQEGTIGNPNIPF